MPETVVLDSKNIDAIVKDATGEGLEPEKVEAKEEPKVEKPKDDDVEGPDGLTPAEKRTLTASMQKAIAKRTAQLRDAEEFAEEQFSTRQRLEREMELMRKELEGFKANFARETPKDEAPKRENFQTDEAYQTALVDYRVDQRFKARAKEEAEQKEKDRQAEVLKVATERVTKAKELVPDFEEVVGGSEITIPPHIAGYMQESELLAELGYHFAKHPDTLTRLSSMSPAKSLVELGKIESTLKPFAPKAKAENGKAPSEETGSQKASPSQETGSAPSKPRVSGPITPIDVGSARQVEKPADQRNVRDEIDAWRKRRGTNIVRRQRH